AHLQAEAVELALDPRLAGRVHVQHADRPFQAEVVLGPEALAGSAEVLAPQVELHGGLLFHRVGQPVTLLELVAQRGLLLRCVGGDQKAERGEAGGPGAELHGGNLSWKGKASRADRGSAPSMIRAAARRHKTPKPSRPRASSCRGRVVPMRQLLSKGGWDADSPSGFPA